MRPITTGTRETWHIQGAALFAVWMLLAVVPALFLQFTVDRWLEGQEEVLFRQAQRQAATEMRNFQNDLEIPRALDYSFDRIRREFSLYHTAPERIEHVVKRYQKFSEKDFESFRHRIRSATGSDPSILVLNDHTRCRTFSWFAPGRHLGTSPDHSRRILEQIFAPYIAKPFFVPGGSDRSIADARQLSEQYLGIGMTMFGFSIHTKPFNPLFAGSGVAFGTRLDCTLPRTHPRHSRPAATVFIIYHSSDINSEHLGRNLLNTPIHRGFRRSIGYTRSSVLPKSIADGEDLLLIDTPPTSFPRQALERLRPRLSDKDKGAVVLGIRASKRAWTHPLRHHLPLLHLLLFIAVAAAALASGRLFLEGFPTWAGLTGKVLIGFALGALVPLCGLSLVTAAWLSSQESSRPATVIAHMQQRLERFEKCYGIIGRNWSKRVLPYKKALSRHLENPEYTQDLMKRAIHEDHGNLGRSIMLFPAGKQEPSMFSDYSTKTHQQLFPMIGAFIFDLMRELKLRPEEEANAGVTNNFITLAQSIADQYIDSSFARHMASRAGLILPSLFGNIHEQQGALFLPGLLPDDSPRGMLIVMASHLAGVIPFLTGITDRVTARPESFKGYDIRYSFYEVDTIEPPVVSRVNLSDSGTPQSWGFPIAERTLRERGDRIETGVDASGTSLVASRWLNQGSYIGVARASPRLRSFRETLRFPLLLFGALLGLWLGVTLSASFLLTRPMPSFLEATRETASGQFAWRLEVPTIDEFGDLAGVFNAMATGLGERAKMSRFVSDEVLETVRRDDQAMLRPGWELARVAILFSDIRGFTTLSETHPPEVIVTMLNDYFTAMELPIREQGGSINSLIGDAILAVFSPKPGLEAPEIRACRAALAMHHALALFNDERRIGGQFPVATGIGIAVGEAMCGHIGSETGRLAHTVLGETAERAPRLEAVSRKTGGSGIIIDEETRHSAGNLIDARAIPDDLLPPDLAGSRVWEIDLGK